MTNWKNLAHRALHKLLPDTVLAHLPGRARLRIREAIYRLSAEREPELVHLELLGRNRGTAIDAGANFGFYTTRLADLYDRVHAFEPHPHLFRQLVDAGLPNVEVRQMALSDRDGEETLHIPLQNGRALLGWGSLEKPDEHGAASSLRVKLARIDELPLRDVAFIKIDVEGHEINVIRGAMATIARDRPDILCEAKGGHPDEIEALLAPLGYRRERLRDRVGIEGSPDNWLFGVTGRS